VRRRQPPPNPGDPPAWVQRFVYADWADESEPAPSWRTDPHEWPSWWLIDARRRWMAACRAWAAAQPEAVDLYRLHYP
jgi:hypothetical protein